MIQRIGDITRMIADYTVGTVIVIAFFLTAERRLGREAGPANGKRASISA